MSLLFNFIPVFWSSCWRVIVALVLSSFLYVFFSPFSCVFIFSTLFVVALTRHPTNRFNNNDKMAGAAIQHTTNVGLVCFGGNFSESISSHSHLCPLVRHLYVLAGRTPINRHKFHKNLVMTGVPFFTASYTQNEYYIVYVCVCVPRVDVRDGNIVEKMLKHNHNAISCANVVVFCVWIVGILCIVWGAIRVYVYRW